MPERGVPQLLYDVGRKSGLSLRQINVVAPASARTGAWLRSFCLASGSVCLDSCNNQLASTAVLFFLLGCCLGGSSRHRTRVLATPTMLSRRDMEAHWAGMHAAKF